MQTRDRAPNCAYERAVWRLVKLEQRDAICSGRDYD